MRPEEFDKLMKLLKESGSKARKETIIFRISDLIELTELLNSLQITERGEETRYGDYWTVDAHPFPGRDEAHMDILLRIKTNELKNQTLVEGLPFMLQDAKGHFWLSAQITDDYGQIWFRNIPVDSYRVKVDNRLLLSALQSEPEEYPLAAASVEDDLITIHIEDPGVYAYIERGEEAEAVLSVYAEFPEYEGAIVFYKIGGESGNLVLESIKTENRWRAVCCLSQSFSGIQESVPQIRVYPLKNK